MPMLRVVIDLQMHHKGVAEGWDKLGDKPGITRGISRGIRRGITRIRNLYS
jgi:hypothetical protein